LCRGGVLGGGAFFLGVWLCFFFLGGCFGASSFSPQGCAQQKEEDRKRIFPLSWSRAHQRMCVLFVFFLFFLFFFRGCEDFWCLTCGISFFFSGRILWAEPSFFSSPPPAGIKWGGRVGLSLSPVLVMDVGAFLFFCV